MRDRLTAALARTRADYAEVRFERSRSSRVGFRGRRLEVAAESVDAGGCVRVLVKGRGWGVASFTRLDDLPRMVEAAEAASRAVVLDEPIVLAPVEPRVDVLPDVVDERDRGAGFTLQGSQVSKQGGDLPGDILVDGVDSDERIEYEQRRSVPLQRRLKPVLMFGPVQAEGVYRDDAQIEALEVYGMDLGKRLDPIPQGCGWVLRGIKKHRPRRTDGESSRGTGCPKPRRRPFPKRATFSHSLDCLR